MLFTLFGLFCVFLVVYGYLNKQDQFGYRTNKIGALLLDVLVPWLSMLLYPFKARKDKAQGKATNGTIALRKRESPHASNEDLMINSDFVNGPKKEKRQKTLVDLLYNYVIIIILVVLISGTVLFVCGLLYQVVFTYFQQREVYAHFRGVSASCAAKDLDPLLHPECSKAKIELSMWPVFRTASVLFRAVIILIENIGFFTFLFVCAVFVFYFYLQSKLLQHRAIDAIKRIKKQM